MGVPGGGGLGLPGILGKTGLRRDSVGTWKSGKRYLYLGYFWLIVRTGCTTGDIIPEISECINVKINRKSEEIK